MALCEMYLAMKMDNYYAKVSQKIFNLNLINGGLFYAGVTI
jgi:hypothetical protein